MECFNCDQQAVRECPRCGALYCDNHGDALCALCSDPASALPSYRIYRGSMLALLIGTIFAVWLLVRPQAIIDADSPPPPALAGMILNPTAAEDGQTIEPSASTIPTPTAPQTRSPSITATAAPPVDPTETPPPSTEPASTREHTVSQGDTLFSIAMFYLPTDKDVLTFVEEIAAFNNIADANSIVLGQVLQIPTQ